MKLDIITPMRVVVQADGVVAVRAEDPTGAFGILPGHADLLTVLTAAVLSWRDDAGVERHAAVHGGVLTVSGGDTVQVATPEAFVSDDLDALEGELLRGVAAVQDSEKMARTDEAQLELAAVRHIQRYLQAARDGGAPPGEWR